MTLTSTLDRTEALRRNNVTLRGAVDGHPLVLGHGFGCDQTMWRHVTPAMDEHRVVAFDHVGCGGSDLTAFRGARYASLDGYATDLIEVVEAVDLGPVAFVGHSASGMIGALAAGRRPDLFSALVLIGASPRYLDDAGYTGGFSRDDVDDLLRAMESNYGAWAQALAPVAMANPDRPHLTEELASSFARTRSDLALEFARAIFLSDHRADLGRVVTPALVVQASDDPMVPAAVGAYLHRAIAGSRYAPLAATGHFPHVAEPDETSAAVRAFLAEVLG